MQCPGGSQGARLPRKVVKRWSSSPQEAHEELVEHCTIRTNMGHTKTVPLEQTWDVRIELSIDTVWL